MSIRNKRLRATIRALAVAAVILGAGLIVGAAMWYAGAPPAVQHDHGPCWDDRYGKDLPPLLGDDC